MRSKYRKNFVYSSEQAMRLCEGLIKEHYIAQKTSESVLIEDAILNYFLPQNRDAAIYVELLYDDETLGKAYARAFCNFASGTYFRAAHDNGQPLVESFSRLVSPSICRFSGKEKAFPHLLQQLTYLTEMMPENDPIHDGQLLNRFIKDLKSNPADVTAQDLTALILRNFEAIGNNSHTYRALMDIAAIAAPTLHNTPALRTEYINIIDQISREW